MRTIKFRGKVILGHASNQWKEGDLIQYHMQEDQQVYNANIRSSCGIVYAINPKTLGQFTGLYDKNGKEVFEGDIVKDDYKRIMKIGEWRYKLCFIAVSETNFRHADFFQWLIGDTNVLECEIIGNIHENPELLK